MAIDAVVTGRLRGLVKISVLGLALAVGGVSGLSGALAQEEDVTVSGGESLAAGATAADIEAVVASILAEVFGEAGVEDVATVTEDSAPTGGDLNVGGSTGGSVVMGGGMGGEISLGDASGGISVGGPDYGG